MPSNFSNLRSFDRTLLALEAVRPSADDRRTGSDAQSDRLLRARDHVPVTLSADSLATLDDSFCDWRETWCWEPFASSAREWYVEDVALLRVAR
jgi:hypothetical protein